MKAKYKPVIDGETLYSWGWSCEKAAGAIGCTASHLRFCVRGIRLMTPEMARKLRELPKGKPITGRYMGSMRAKSKAAV